MIRLFVQDLVALKIAGLCGVSRVCNKLLFLKMRLRFANLCEQVSLFCGQIKVDESYFGARRIRGKRDRGASGKTIVFGLLKQQDNVYTEIIPDASKAKRKEFIHVQWYYASIDSKNGMLY